MAADVENTTVITAGMDATDYVTAAGQMVDANAALAASGEAVVAAGGTITISQTKTTRAIIDGGAAYDRLKRSLDPAYASAQQYAKATDTITAAVNLHGVSQTEANAMMALAATRYNSASLAGDKFTLSSRQTEFIMHEMAFIEVEIGFPLALAGPGSQPASQTIALLVDTGARSTHVAKAVADALSLPIVGERPLRSSTGSVVVDIYLGDLRFRSINISYSGMRLPEFPNPSGHYQGVLGMDILNTGTLYLDGIRA